MLLLSVGQKVAYPNQGVCLVEEIRRKNIGSSSMSFYSLRVLGDDSTILVPTANAESVGVRPIICRAECRKLIDSLQTDFDKVSGDWKIRSREYHDKLQSGDVFEAADVLKKLTFLSHEKKLSFREQNMLEKSRFLVISEIVNAEFASAETIGNRIDQLLEAACTRHLAVEAATDADAANRRECAA